MLFSLCQPWCSSTPTKVLTSQPPQVPREEVLKEEEKEEDPHTVSDLASTAVQVTRVPEQVSKQHTNTAVKVTWPSSLPAYMFSKATVSVDEDYDSAKNVQVQVKVGRLPPLPRSPRRH
jgi:hypothetical protein